MERICANCNNFDAYQKREKGELWCEEHCKWVPAKGNACKKYEELPMFGAYDKKSRSEEELNSKCYITTAVVKILGMKDDCPILQTLRFLRGYYMQKNPCYRDILMTYDVVGPMIARALWADENRLYVANNIYICLVNATKLVAREKMEDAIDLYIDMTEALINLYSTSFEIGEEAKKAYNQESGGHGAFTIKKKS